MVILCYNLQKISILFTAYTHHWFIRHLSARFCDKMVQINSHNINKTELRETSNRHFECNLIFLLSQKVREIDGEKTDNVLCAPIPRIVLSKISMLGVCVCERLNLVIVFIHKFAINFVFFVLLHFFCPFMESKFVCVRIDFICI